MDITVINGTEKYGVTYRLKEIFLAAFKDKANITEYYLPKDCPNFCKGCISCTIKGENTCKDAEYIGRIDKSLLEADLIVMTSPAYVFHATGAMKAFLDHFTYRWMPHRPASEMFGKRAVIITQCLGAGAKSVYTNFITKIKFSVCRLMQQTLHKNDPEYLDGKYWTEQGWLGKIRPWKY